MTDAAEKKGYVKGNLKQVPLPKALNFVSRADKTGVLAITQDKKKVHIHFLDGRIVYVTSSYFSGLSLGDFLLKEGKISLQAHEESLEAIKGTDTKQGSYLVEKGYLSPHDMIETLNRQVLEKLFWLFEWEEGDFFFKESDIVEESLRLVKIEMQRLIYQGIRDYMPLNSLPTEFKGRKESMMFRRPELPFRLETLGLGPIDTRILSFVNGRYTLRQIVALARLKKRAIYKILYGLFLTDVICFSEGLTSRKITPQDKAQSDRPGGIDDDGYEISVSNNIIEEALKSVDRIREQVKAQKDQDIPVEPASVYSKVQAGDETLDELGSKLDAALSEGEPAGMQDGFGFSETADQDQGGYDEEMDAEEEFGFSESGDDDGFGFEEDAIEDVDAEYEDPDKEPESPTDEMVVDINDYSDPEEVKKQGIMLLEEERYEDAEIFLQRAVELLPEDFGLYAYLGWAIYRSAVGQGEEGLAIAEKTIKMGMGTGKSKYQHFLYLGKIYMEEEQYEFAELHFIKTLEMNVDCAEARESIKKIHAK